MNLIHFLCIFTYFISLTEQYSDNLKQVILIHRHGDRTPIHLYPKDPYANNSLWPDGFGELTIKGKIRMHNLGAYVRERYGSFLTNDPKEVYIRSSAAHRCLNSAQLFLAGFYPPEGRWIWNNKLLWQPFPVLTEPLKEDGMLNPSSECPNAKLEEKSIRNSEEVKKYNLKFKDLFKYLTLNTGKNISNIFEAQRIYDVIKIEREMNFLLPDWVNQNVINQLKQISDLTFYFDYKTELIQRLRAGLILKEIKHRLLKTINRKLEKDIPFTEIKNDIGESEKETIHLYSTHDTLIAALLSAFNAFKKHSPPYGAAIIIELHKYNETEHIVKTFYLNETESKMPIPIRTNACEQETMCHLGLFLRNIEQFIPYNWREECGLEIKSDDNSFKVYIIIDLLLLLICFGILMVIVIQIKRKEKPYNYRLLIN